jgi:hypothetical protein
MHVHTEKKNEIHFIVCVCIIMSINIRKEQFHLALTSAMVSAFDFVTPNMTDDINENNDWNPIEGVPKKRRLGGNGTCFAKKRADHRNAILKDWAKRLEDIQEPKVPIDYTHPFDNDKCIYCLTRKIGSTGDEFRPSSQRGRYNIVNCVPCCGFCNSSKQDKCGSNLIKWIKESSQIPIEQQEKIINWYQENEMYLIIETSTFDNVYDKTYGEMINGLDDKLNKVYEEFR